MSKIYKAIRLFHTVRHLKPIQVYGRFWFRFNCAKPNLAKAPSTRLAKNEGWCVPARRNQSLIAENKFEFLNEIHKLKIGDWDNPEISKLWIYNLHYFDDLNAHNSGERTDLHRRLIGRWVSENKPAIGTGWEPYPTSLRIVNWIKWHLGGTHLSQDAVQSLAVQARWLTKRLEWHLLGNHLFTNAKALVFAGLFFEGEEADCWLEAGINIVTKEIDEQVLQDGANFELSPMYHALMFEDLLDILNVARVFNDSKTKNLEEKIVGKLPSVAKWLKAMSHPDGAISFFNDAAIGIAPSNADLFSYFQNMGYEIPEIEYGFEFFKESGYARISDDKLTLIMDIAEIGPSYIPGHAHADTLSFECSIHNQRVFVNSGTSQYGVGAERLRQRGTAAHNSLVIENENSSEIWSGFRVARRACIIDFEFWNEKKTQFIKASHNGYNRLTNKPVHSRTISHGNNELVILDEVKPVSSAYTIYHLHPNVSIRSHSDKSIDLSLPNGEIVTCQSTTQIKVEQGTWHPQFGKSVPNQHIIIPVIAGVNDFTITWGVR